ncbi:MAG TPA: hypothetical protein DCP11_03330 [Microbacteriaceae bacterium]|nr:hypothetical protein [Microbacteriaceae bacterium]
MTTTRAIVLHTGQSAVSPATSGTRGLGLARARRARSDRRAGGRRRVARARGPGGRGAGGRGRRRGTRGPDRSADRRRADHARNRQRRCQRPRATLAHLAYVHVVSSRRPIATSRDMNSVRMAPMRFL